MSKSPIARTISGTYVPQRINRKITSIGPGASGTTAEAILTLMNYIQTKYLSNCYNLLNEFYRPAGVIQDKRDPDYK